MSEVFFSAQTATGVSRKLFMNGAKHTFQAYGTTSAGAGAATVVIQVSNVPVPGTGATSGDWKDAGTITLSALATTSTSDGFAVDAAWRWARARITAISGTDATVSVAMGT